MNAIRNARVDARRGTYISSPYECAWVPPVTNYLSTLRSLDWVVSVRLITSKCDLDVRALM
jgi:hypothetical protein